MHQRPRTLWEEGDRPGSEAASLAFAVLFTVAVIDLLLSGRLDGWFDLAFVVACAGAALGVRPTDFFVVGVLPPLAMATTMLVFSTDPATIAGAEDGVVQALTTGLADHSAALVIGYAVCLALLAVRRSFLARHPH